MFENGPWPVWSRSISNDIKLTNSGDKNLSFKLLLDRVSLSLRRTLRRIRAQGRSTSISWTGRFQCLFFWKNNFHGNSKKKFFLKRERHYLKTNDSFIKRIFKFVLTLLGIWIDLCMFFSGNSVLLISNGGRTQIQATWLLNPCSPSPSDSAELY